MHYYQCQTARTEVMRRAEESAVSGDIVNSEQNKNYNNKIKYTQYITTVYYIVFRILEYFE